MNRSVCRGMMGVAGLAALGMTATQEHSGQVRLIRVLG